jgi:hypothetical protein
MKEMFSLLYDEQKKLQYLIGCIAFLIAPTGALLQIGGWRWDAARYIVSLPESFFSYHPIQFFIPVSS